MISGASCRGLGPAVLAATACLVATLLLMPAAWAQTDHPGDLDRRGLELYRAGKAAEAIPLAERALALREKALPADHPQIAASLDNLAQLYKAQGRFAEAELLYQRALKIIEKALPADHPDMARSLHNLANVYRAQGRLADATSLHERA